MYPHDLLFYFHVFFSFKYVRPTGIRYWNGSRDSEFALMTDSDPTKSTFEEYIDCQRNSLYQQPMEMSLPATGQRVSFTVTIDTNFTDSCGRNRVWYFLLLVNKIEQFFYNYIKIPPLTLNERLSDAVGMRLAHDTLARFGSIASEERLLWLDLDVSQLFYLAYAQVHCRPTFSFLNIFLTISHTRHSLCPFIHKIYL